MEPFSGQRLDHYLLREKLREDGFVTVYAADDEKNKQPVLLKLVRADLARKPSFQRRFLETIQPLFDFDHPGLVNILNYGQRPSLLYWVIARQPGIKLADLLADEAAPVPSPVEALGIIIQLAEALDYAHKRGMLHTTIRPELVFTTTENRRELPITVQLDGFIYANLAAQLTEETVLDYTYAAPEQCLESSLDGRADIYSLGVILYQLLSGSPPFTLHDQTEAVHTHLTAPLPDLAALRPDLPPEFAAIVAQALARQPAQRFKTAAAMARICAGLRQKLPGLQDAQPAEGSSRTQPLADYLRARLYPPAPAALAEKPATGLLSPQKGRLQMETRPAADDLVPPENGERLLHTFPGQATKTLHLFKSQIQIGRLRDNDLVLSAPEISRRHARLERRSAGWYVIDLKSLGRTYVNGRPIPPGESVLWPENSILQIGPYTLYWLTGGAAPPVQPRQPRIVAPEPALTPTLRPSASTLRRSLLSSADSRPQPPQMPAAPPGTIQMQTSNGALTVAVNPARTELAPGERSEVRITLDNHQSEPLTGTLTVAGIPARWIGGRPDPLTIAPGNQIHTILTLNPPRRGSSRAGRHPFHIQVQLTGGNEEQVMVPLELEIKPFDQFQAVLTPVPDNQPGHFQVQIANQGNIAREYSVTGRAVDRPLQMKGERGRIVVAPQKRKTVDIMIEPEKRPFVGRRSQAIFQIMVKANTGEKQTINGELPLVPRIGPLLFSLLLLILLAFSLTGWLLRDSLPAFSQASSTPINPMVILSPAADEELRAQMLTATRQSAMATQSAATATAVLEQQLGDSDGDGLSDAREAELSTLPDNPDTDGDGLTDGQEVNELGTDPRSQDSDNDGLADGLEVNRYQTSPLHIDTDGDGITDFQELQANSDPLLAATPRATAIIPGGAPTTAPVNITVSPTRPRTTISPSPPPVNGGRNAPPQANNDFITTNEDSPTTFSILNNDSDPDGDTLTVLNLSATQQGGTASLLANGLVQYTPPPNYFGGDSLSYTISDGVNQSSATILITVNPVNDAPVANDDQVTGQEGTAVIITPLANDTDPDSSSLTIANFTQPANGSVSQNGGSFNYQPAPDFAGTDQFTYVAGDGQLTSNTATITIVVADINDPPFFVPGPNVTVLEDAGTVIRTGWATEINPGAPSEAGQLLNFVITTDNPGLFNSLPVIDATTGTLRFTPAPNMNGSAQVSMYLQDNGGSSGGGQNRSAIQQIQIAVTAVNDPPLFTSGGDISAAEDSINVVHAGWAGGISTGAANESGQTLVFEVTAADSSLFRTPPAIDVVSGDLTYSPAADAFGATELTITLVDNGGINNSGQSSSAPVTVSVTINPVNDPPYLNPGPVVTVAQNSGSHAISDWAREIRTGPDNEEEQFFLNTPLTLNGDNDDLFAVLPSLDLISGDLSFVVATGAVGTANFEFTIQDNGGRDGGGADTSEPYSLQITILPAGSRSTGFIVR